jgi:hypothetical protein
MLKKIQPTHGTEKTIKPVASASIRSHGGDDYCESRRQWEKSEPEFMLGLGTSPAEIWLGFNL